MQPLVFDSVNKNGTVGQPHMDIKGVFAIGHVGWLELASCSGPCLKSLGRFPACS